MKWQSTYSVIKYPNIQLVDCEIFIFYINKSIKFRNRSRSRSRSNT